MLTNLKKSILLHDSPGFLWFPMAWFCADRAGTRAGTHAGVRAGTSAWIRAATRARTHAGVRAGPHAGIHAKTRAGTRAGIRSCSTLTLPAQGYHPLAIQTKSTQITNKNNRNKANRNARRLPMQEACRRFLL